jgi:ATP-binding cassette subfamily C (CFTR/MRP) protein 1
LKEVDMTISGGERVAIIGRTGAGKTSLAAALFRLTEVASGNIEIDGIDIAQTSLQDLHSRLSIILKIQRSSRALFAATSIRSTPMKTVSSALPSDTPTSPTTMAFPKSRHKIRQKSSLHLDCPVNEDGSNLSQGQRQLLTLARALVRDSQIIMCDGATSSVDSVTDAAVQETIRTKFGGKAL